MQHRRSRCALPPRQFLPVSSGGIIATVVLAIALILLWPSGATASETASRDHEVAVGAHPQEQLPPTVGPAAPAPTAEAAFDTSTLASGQATGMQPAGFTTSGLPIGFVWNGGPLYGGPGPEYPSFGELAAGDIVELLDKYQDWWWVRTSLGDGWVEASGLIIDGEASVPVAAEGTPGGEDIPPGLVTLAGVVRAGPSVDYPAILPVEVGTTLEILGKNGDWWQVWIKPHVGWINSALLMATNEPGVEPAPAQGLTTSSVAKLRPTPPPTPVPARPVAPVAPAKPVAPAAAAAPPAPAVPPKPAAPAPAESLWSVKAEPGTLVLLPDVVAPNPRLAAEVVQPFLRARTRVLRASGVDYLGRLDDALRGISFHTDKPGVASQSWHKAGRAIDVAQSFRVGGVEGVVFMRDAEQPRLYRVLIRCARQDGSLGEWYGPKRLPAGREPAFYVDVTTILLSEGFKRIPPVGDVSEAWHYELRGNHTWASAMQQVYGLRTLRQFYPDVWR